MRGGSHKSKYQAVEAPPVPRPSQKMMDDLMLKNSERFRRGEELEELPDEYQLTEEQQAELLRIGALRTVADNGDIVYKQLDGILHREDGPAVIYQDGTEEWWRAGKKFENEQDWQEAGKNSQLPTDSIELH